MRVLWMGSWWLGGCAEPNALLDTAVVPTTATTTTTQAPAEAAIEVFPTYIDFGEVAPECSQRVNLEVRNVGNYPLEVLSFELSEDPAGVFAHDGEPGILAAGEVWLVEIAFTPQSAKAYTGARLRIESNDVNDWKVDVTIEGAGSDDEPMIETFTQTEAESTDVLWVIDDDPAMSDRLDDLIAATPSLIDGYTSLGIDAHIGVIDGDNTSADRGGQMIGGFVRASDSDAAEALAANLLAATAGSPDLAFFDTTQAAISEPLISSSNDGFRREEAPLSIVAYVRNDDSSAQNGATFGDWLNTNYDPELSSFSAISGPKSGLFPCGLLSLDPVDPAPRIGTAVGRTGGAHWLICDHEIADIVDALPAITSGLLDRWTLERPITTVAWVYVTVNGVEVLQDSQDGWTYDDKTQQVVFHGASIPGPGSEVQIAYPAQAPCLEQDTSN